MRLMWCCAAAFVLFVITEASTLRPTQSTTRSSRQWRPQQQKDNSHLSSRNPEEIETTSARTRNSRINQEFVPKETIRSRTRKKPPENKENVNPQSSQTRPQKERNERYEPKKYSSIRSRSRHRNEETNKETSSPPPAQVRSRTRNSFRRAPTQTPLEISSPFIDERKIEIISSTFDDITKLPEKKSATSQMTKKPDVTSYQSTDKIQTNRRGRFFSRKPESNPALDLDGSGTTYSIAVSEKEPTTSKIIEDPKRGRKLRYKPQLTNNDQNTIGQGITISHEVKNSSQNNLNKITSQIEPKKTTPATVEGSDQRKDNLNDTTNINLKKVLKRPHVIGKVAFKPVSSIVKEKKVEEISDDDNYPAPFKAMFHAKHATTQLDSPPRESLSVRASQRIDRTLTPLLSPTIDKETLITETLLQNRSIDVQDAEKKKVTRENIEIKPQVSNNDTETINSTTKRPLYRPRAVYVPKSRKFVNSTSPVDRLNTTTPNPVNKFSRKPKAILSVKKENSTPDNNETIKPLKKNSRPSYFTRRKNTTGNENSTLKNDISQPYISKIATEKNVNKYLPRTSYYTRFKSIKENVTETPKPKDKEALQKDIVTSTQMSNKTDNSIYFRNNKEKKMIVIAVTSEDLSENNNSSSATEVTNNNTRIEYYQISPSTKYHASYKKDNPSVTNPAVENSSPSIISEITNIKTRKQSRHRPRPNDFHDYEEVNTEYQKSFGESFSKTTEASTNGIAPESDKPKNRFSSKFRASYITDQPFYKPTVPSVSSSTAWLKFFVTDRELMKSVQEPMWFENLSGTTESMSRNITNANISSSSSSPSITETPPELVKGEESILGPDMNSISFTQTRSTLASEDLRLSESIMKPLHVMNVETSNHSPSVTISIFDALAEILTSTPRPQTTSTTEMTHQTLRNDVKQTIHGVSNDVNNDLVSQQTFMSAFTKPVQFSDQTTPNVINSLEQSVASTSLEEQYNTSPVPVTDPVPTNPNTPISARRPFAVKILYSDTESSTVKSTIQPSSIQPTTDTLTMVPNPVSDLLPSNTLVSSELTSMLSGNIETLLKNLDENTKAKVSLDMAKMLKNLIPRVLNGMTNDFDNLETPNTTPYSLEDIKDTEVHLNFDDPNKLTSNKNDTDIFSSLFLQNVTSDIPVQLEDRLSGVGNNVESVVNILAPIEVITTESEPISRTSTDVLTTFFEMTLRNQELDTVTLTVNDVETTVIDELLDSDVVDLNINNVSSFNNQSFVEKKYPLPLFTNAKISDFTLGVTASYLEPETTSSRSVNYLSTTLTSSLPLSSNVELFDQSIETPDTISPMQLLILSKKAAVLKMIQDLLTKHNEELAAVTPMSETFLNNQPLSDRLTEILNGMNTTPDDKTLLSDLIFSPMTTPNPLPFRSVFTNPTPIESENISIESSMGTTQIIEPRSNFNLSEPTMSIPMNSDTKVSVSLRASENQGSTEDDIIAKATESSTKALDFTNSDVTVSTVTSFEETDNVSDSMNNEATTEYTVTSPMLPLNINSSSETNEPATTTQTTTEIEPTIASPPSSTTSYVRREPPKKDFVIFGILPNNTVVRKDPNDDALETLTEASPYIVYGVLPNNTIIRKFPNGTRVPRIIQKIDILPISPWSLRNPYSPIHNNPAIVRPQSNPIRLSTNFMTSTDNTNIQAETLINDTVNKTQTMIIATSSLNLRQKSLNDGIATTNKSPTEKSTASHVLSLRTSTMLPSIDEILLNSISSAAKEEMVISSMMSSTHEPRILTLDIDPETQQIRTEKPSDGSGNSVFKYIPIDEVKVQPQDSNVQKLATRSNVNSDPKVTTPHSETTQIPQNTISTADTTTHQMTDNTYQVDVPTQSSVPVTTLDSMVTTMIQDQATTAESIPWTTTTFNTPSLTEVTTSMPEITTEETISSQKEIMHILATTSQPTTNNFQDDNVQFQKDTLLLESLLQATNRDAKNLNIQSTHNILATVHPPETTTTTRTTTVRQQNIDQANLQLLQALLMSDSNKASLATTINRKSTSTTTQPVLNDDLRILQQLLLATGNKQINPSLFLNNFPLTTPVSKSSTRRSLSTTTTTSFSTTTTSKPSTTISPSLEDDIKKFKEDTLLLQALLKATGQDPANFNIPTFPNIESSTVNTTPRTTTTTTTTTTTPKPTTTTQNIQEDIKKIQEDALLLQALLQATGQNTNNLNIPTVTGVTSNVRVSSNHMTTSATSNPTTTIPIRPVYIPTTAPFTNTNAPSTVWTQSSLNEDVGISTTHPPFDIQRIRLSTTTVRPESTTTYRRFQRPTTVSTARKVPERVSVTTEQPKTSTFSVEEDLVFLNNLKSVLNTNQAEDPESSLANRIIALAVEKSLTEIQTNRDGKAIHNNKINRVGTTVKPTTITTTTTTSKPTTTTAATKSTPSIEEDLKQFEEDSKLLQALLKATGQNPANFKIPTIMNAQSNVRLSPTTTQATEDNLKVLSNLLSSPSPFNKPSVTRQTTPATTTMKPVNSGSKDNLRVTTDDAQLLQTLIKLQEAQDLTTTTRTKLAITGQTSNEAINKLLQQTQQGGMVSEATKAPLSLSTEYGKSNDALLAALLKEQGFGPTTASSLDEQIKLAALLNQVVVTPKPRRVTTPPPPPPPRRPVLDGLAWLWQQWRETGPGTGASRPRRPAPSQASTATSNRVSWFGSGPFTGNADDGSSNRVPLDPPSATSNQAPARGQLVSAAINVTRAFSQFLGAAIQGAAQTVQNVIRAGQRATNEVYGNGSGR